MELNGYGFEVWATFDHDPYWHDDDGKTESVSFHWVFLHIDEAKVFAERFKTEHPTAKVR